MTGLHGPTRNVRVVASNLHVGGGVQVAASLIDEMVRLQRETPLPGAVFTYEVSPAVWRNLSVRTTTKERIDVRRRRPATLRYLPSDLARRYDVALVVFGPFYFPLRTRRRIMGYADVTSVYGDVPGVPPLQGVQRYLARVRSRWSLRTAGGSHVLVVETDAMRRRLIESLGTSDGRVRVIPNVVNERVLQGGGRIDVSVPRLEQREKFLIYTTRAYAHKNLQFLPALRREALSRYGFPLRFLVTLTEREWSAQSEEFRQACVNLGELSVEQLAAAHGLADGAIFPSLLEAFSATPIEALALGTPLFASDRDFVRATCRDAAVYFDPLDPGVAAREIVTGFRNPDGQEHRKEEGLRVVRDSVTARQRAQAYIGLIKEQLTGVPAARSGGAGEPAWTA